MARIHTQCLQCGQTDDHPKIWMAEGPKHYDCLSFGERAAVVESSAPVAEVIEVCEGGLRGNDLIDHILTTHGEGN